MPVHGGSGKKAGTPKGLASWLQLTSHLSKPDEAQEPGSPASSSDDSSARGEAQAAPVAVLDFTALEPKAAPPAAAKLAAKPSAKPAAPVTVPAPAPAQAAAQAAAPAAPKQAPAAAPRAALARKPAARGAAGSTGLSMLLAACLLALLLLAAPVALHAYAPALARRYTPAGELRWRDLTAGRPAAHHL